MNDFALKRSQFAHFSLKKNGNKSKLVWAPFGTKLFKYNYPLRIACVKIAIWNFHHTCYNTPAISECSQISASCYRDWNILWDREQNSKIQFYSRIAFCACMKSLTKKIMAYGFNDIQNSTVYLTSTQHSNSVQMYKINMTCYTTNMYIEWHLKT